MKIKEMSLGPLGTNCYIVYDDQHALVIDPGGDADQIISFLTMESIEPKAILLTHAHFDHIGGVEPLRSYYGINVLLHDNEAAWLEDPGLNGSALFIGEEIKTKKAEQPLKPGTRTISSFTFDILHTPGHSPGSVSLVFSNEKIVFGGDALFQHGIGRTDLPGGDFEQLIQSIQQKLYLLDDSYVVYPGHGPATTIAEEKRNNPFVQR
ncbi:hydroxyacylglutathione hydrolase [Lentibacillus populi]|uniref:Hydroxyacylglutathione hydrolase n=1 Tax=Lentibacillus populi TaxID=1827502 RepID=A0A9W5X3S0_9BACI|nr:MBL fold metallo-hydrolase [Lentibacillus populi]GGB29381.1 hydroxyacylglutathione hydrolase [Lentibacillus populi]